MPGLLQQAQGQPPQNPQPTSPMISIDAAQAETGKRVNDMKKIVLAGQKILYSEGPGTKILADVTAEPESIGDAVATVMALILSEVSSDRMDPEMIMPAGVMLVSDVLDYVAKADGIEPGEDLAKAAIEAFVVNMMEAAQGVEGPAQPGASMGGQPVAAQAQTAMMGG